MTPSSTNAPAASKVYPQYEKASQPAGCLAVIKEVEEDSPAWCVGLEPGMALTHVNGVPLRDIITWQWESDGFEVEITTSEGDVAVMERDMGEDWGITFADCLFDPIICCRNACVFCFMAMLPQGLRSPLTLKDDDYRLSFLQGNFVTLTNLAEEDFQRIVRCGLSPLHVSLHAVDPQVRRQLMGKHAQHGLDMLERLLDAGIQIHVQLVICPGINDGPVLVETLGWVERHPGVLSVGLVPLGYTRFQDRFTSSFSDDPDAAAELIEVVREFQEDSRNDTRVTKYHLADEFYLDAGYKFPPAEFYDGYPQFQDGIGMMRSFIDDWNRLAPQVAKVPWSGSKVVMVVGEAFAKVLEPLVKGSSLEDRLEVLPVKNRFFGGNTDVTGLLTAVDMVYALNHRECPGLVLVSSTCFNADGLTLDDKTLEDMKEQTGLPIEACLYSAEEVLGYLG